MKIPSSKATLAPARRRLVEIMQQLNFGRIESLNVRYGEPAFSPPPNLIEDIKLGGENGPRPERDRDDFLLKSSVIELFEHLEGLCNGTVASIEVRYGLPVRLIIHRAPSDISVGDAR